MTIGELKKMLEKYPEDTEVVNCRFSDYQIISESEWEIVQGVEHSGWVMRSHPTMSEENKAAEKSYLCLSGN